MTAFAVAHNFFGQDRRIVAVDRDGKRIPPSIYSAGSDGDPRWVIDLIDAEFDLPPDQIKEYQVQFRPFELAEIKDIALNPRTTGKPATKADAPPPSAGDAVMSSSVRREEGASEDHDQPGVLGRCGRCSRVGQAGETAGLLRR